MIRRTFLASFLLAACAAHEDDPTVLIVAPESGAASNGAVVVAVAYSRAPLEATLLVNAERQPLASPFTRADLDTGPFAEGTITLRVEARFASEDGSAPFLVTSPPVALVVDRTHPQIVAGSVARNAYGDPGADVTFTFSEPVVRADVGVTWGGDDAPTLAFGLSPDGRKLTVTGFPDDPGRAIRSVPLSLDFSLLHDAAGNGVANGIWPMGWLTQRRLNVHAERRASHPALALDGAGAPVVAWSETDAWAAGGASGEGPFVRLAGWDGEAWTAIPFGAGGDRSGYGAAPDLVFDGHGDPVVAAVGFDATIEVTRRTDGTWSRLGTAVSTAPGFTPSLAASGTELVAAWVEADAAPDGDAPCGDVAVARWNGSAWKRLGGAVQPAGACGRQPKVVFTAGGAPWVAWVDPVGLSVEVAAWTGSAWAFRGAFGGTSFDLAPDASAAVLAVDDGLVAVRRWDAGQGAWNDLGQVAYTGSALAGPPALSTQHGIAVAWSDGIVSAAVVGETGLEPAGTLDPSAPERAGLAASDPAVVREADGTLTLAFAVYGADGLSARVYGHAFAP